MKTTPIAVFFTCMLTVFVCDSVAVQQSATSESTNATVYHNGHILTMSGDAPYVAEALIEESGQIVFVGTLKDARQRAGGSADDFDLEGATLMPGFIEPHLTG